MQFTPDDISKEKRLPLIDRIPDCEILTKVTGREEINLNPHSHNRHQIIYILSGWRKEPFRDRKTLSVDS